ncbi:hypothetical protein JQ506_22950 [Shinella sp. PSBB067]|uniref:hypothetical protein n=1 Tax=Shinella sp. PSBB067 TaxID=2715959 RepID=UPI00193B8B2D|nr:hypothetical protein [Shinella sp. PSBB067]QRI63620.1 hypothetical protein JQ506_22950 [Shinella sp. PSBB067]
MGMFDDLIPGNQSSNGISFDDLIPKRSGQHLSYEEGLALMEEEERRQRMQGGSGSFGAAVASTIDGIPIVGPMLKGATERAAAGVSSLFNGQSYADNLEEAQSLTKMAQDEHPYITAAGNITGAVGGTLPGVIAFPAAFGAGTGGLVARTGASALSGTAIGGTDAAIRSGGDFESTAWGAGTGFGLGAIGPAVGKAVGAGARNVIDWFGLRSLAKAAGTTPKTVSRLAQVATRDGLDNAAIRSRLAELGPDAMLADLGPNLSGYTGALANMPGRGQQTVRSALDARHAGANARLAVAVDDTLGRAPVPSYIDDMIAEGQRAVGQQYGQVFRNARAVDTSRIAEVLESRAVNLRGEAQKAVQRVRSMLNVTGTDVLDPHPGTLFQTRQAIDGMMATETNPKVIQALAEVRSQVDDVLARSVPGLKEVDGQFAELARQREALQRGQTILDSGRTAPRPVELAQEAMEGALPQGRFMGPSGGTARMRQGARAEIDRILGNNANDVSRLNTLIKSDGDWNRARLTTLFGRAKADRLFRVLENEQLFATTRNNAMGNSFTAGRQQAIAELGGHGGDDILRQAFGADGLRGTARAGSLKVAEHIKQMIMGPYYEAQRASLADAITSNRRSSWTHFPMPNGRRNSRSYLRPSRKRCSSGRVPRGREAGSIQQMKPYSAIMNSAPQTKPIGKSGPNTLRSDMNASRNAKRIRAVTTMQTIWTTRSSTSVFLLGGRPKMPAIIAPRNWSAWR